MKLLKKLSKTSLGNEVIGEIENESPPNKKQKIRKLKKDNIEVPKENSNIRIDKSALVHLGIELNVDISNIMTPEDIGNMEFSLSAPTGLDPKEVEDALDEIQRQMSKYISIIKSRQDDFLIILKELNKATEELQEMRQFREINAFIENQSESAKDKDRILELTNEISELKSKNSKLKQTIKELEEKLKNTSQSGFEDNDSIVSSKNDILINKDDSNFRNLKERFKTKTEENIDESFSLESVLEDF